MHSTPTSSLRDSELTPARYRALAQSRAQMAHVPPPRTRRLTGDSLTSLLLLWAFLTVAIAAVTKKSPS